VLRILDADLQLKLPFFLMVATAVSAGLVVAIAKIGYSTRLSALLDAVTPEAQDHLVYLAEDFAVTTALVALLYASVVFGSCIRYTQRFVGPLVPICHHLRALKKGDYSSRVRLRRNDSLQQMARELNELAEILEGRTEAMCSQTAPIEAQGDPLTRAG
jgi:nitrogen fixation/metabolism regulation signal transduction histidine kinase